MERLFMTDGIRKHAFCTVSNRLEAEELVSAYGGQLTDVKGYLTGTPGITMELTIEHLNENEY